MEERGLVFDVLAFYITMLFVVFLFSGDVATK